MNTGWILFVSGIMLFILGMGLFSIHYDKTHGVED